MSNEEKTIATSEDIDSLDQDLAAETLRANAAEQTIIEALAREVTRATAAETALQTAVDTLNARIDELSK